jgi:hypothetical protein
MLKIIFLNKIILVHFQVKSILKSNIYYYFLKHPLIFQHGL